MEINSFFHACHQLPLTIVGISVQGPVKVRMDCPPISLAQQT